MQAEGTVVNPGKIEISVTITMSIDEWKMLLKQMENRSWPACDVDRAIVDLVRQIEARFYHAIEKKVM